jgi:hypothetical protein
MRKHVHGYADALAESDEREAIVVGGAAVANDSRPQSLTGT